MQRHCVYSLITFCAAAFGLPLRGGAEELPPEFTLGRFLPDDTWLYVHRVSNPERQWLEKEWDEILDALKGAGIQNDVMSLVVSLAPEDQREARRQQIQDVLDRLLAVRWRDLMAHEVAFGERISTELTGYKYYVLTRGRPDTTEANVQALVAILQDLARLNQQLTLHESTRDGVRVWTLRLVSAQPDEPPLDISLFHKGDVVGAALGAEALKDMVGLMTGKSEKRSIVQSPRFRQALATVQSPKDAVVFFDFRAFITDLKKLLGKASPKCCPGKAGDLTVNDRTVARVVQRVIELTDVLDYTVTSVATVGTRERSESVLRLQEGKRKCSLACACLERKPFARFDRFIPADATAFSLSGSIDLAAFYKLAIDLVENDFPDGEAHLARWNAWLKTVGFDPHGDLFSWWSGETVSVTLPARIVTPMSSTDSVTMIRVKDGELARRKLETAIGFAQRKLQGVNQMLLIRPADVSAEGFQEITHPMLAMFLRPVIGVTDEWLILGTSASAINRCLDVAAEKAPSIVENPHFKAEGLTPPGPVLSASFKDASRFGQELGGIMTSIGVAGTFATASIPEDPDNREFKRVAQSLLGICTKLGPVLQKIDFYSSEAAITTYDGETTMRTERVVTFKPPAETATVSGTPARH